MELSRGTKRLLERYQEWEASLQPKEIRDTITVDEVAAKVASFYEKIRGVVDWREEHLLRKMAVERVFKRRILLNGNTAEMAEPLISELIRGGHFPNEKILTSKITEVQNLINKYAYLIETNKNAEHVLLSVGACEIEEVLAPPIRERALLEFMGGDMEESLQTRQKDKGKISEEERKLLILVGVHRALFKLDDATIVLHALERFYPAWNRPETQDLALISQSLENTLKFINGVLHHAIAEKFYQFIELRDTPYLILGDIITNHPVDFQQLLANPGTLEEEVRTWYNIRLRKVQSSAKKAAFFSTLSVFISKMLIALAIEIPIDTYVTHEINYITIMWSIVLPPIFLLFLITTKRSTSEDNFQRVLLEVSRITYETERKIVQEISLPTRRKGFISMILHLTYLFSFVFSFGILAKILLGFGFSILSTVVFLLFFSLVSYAGTRIRHRSQELIVGKQKEGFIFGLFDIFFLPVVQVGKWFSSQISRYNILVLILNVLIETPFQVFVEFIEQLRSFWKEKKEEIH